VLIAVVAVIDSPRLKDRATQYYEGLVRLVSSEQLLRCEQKDCSGCGADLYVMKTLLGRTTIKLDSFIARMLPNGGPQQFNITQTSTTSYRATSVLNGRKSDLTIDRVDGTMGIAVWGSAQERKAACDRDPTDHCRAIVAVGEKYPVTGEVVISTESYRCRLAVVQF
jgi:hypothetical protein